MKHKLGIAAFSLIEISIGLITIISIIVSLLQGTSTKPLEVLIFVLATSALSFSLGIGLLRRNLACYHLLLFLSTVIIFSKVLIFTKIIALSGAIEVTIPQSTKNIISIIYHALVLIYFTRPAIRTEFGEKRNVLFSLKLPF